MDKSYLKLFMEIAHAVELLSEKALDYNHSQNDAKGEAAATTMREDYSRLYDKMRAEEFDFTQLTRADYIKLLVGTMIVVNNIMERIQGEQKALSGYKTEVIPKLQRIIDECQTDEEAQALAKEIFELVNI